MKGLKTFLATVLLMFACGVTQAKVKVVNVAVPGTLEQLVGQKDRYRIKEMRVSGRLNATDMLFIADMAGRTMSGTEPQKGSCANSTCAP